MLTKAQRREAIHKRRVAMSHPLRAEIFRLIVDTGPVSPVQLARELDAKTENVSFHCKRLVELDCAELAYTRPVRGATEHFYRHTERSLVATEEWDDVHPVEGVRIASDVMQAIVDDFVISQKAYIVGSDEKHHMSRTPSMVDDQGFEEGLEILERARLEMAEVTRRSAEREAAGGSSTFPTSVNIAYFKMPGGSR